MNKISLKKMDDHFTDADYVLMIGLGFDQRCLSVLNDFPKNKVTEVVGISNAGWEQSNSANIEAFKSIAGSQPKIIGEKSPSVHEVADGIVRFFESKRHLNPIPHFLIDISALSHELVVILLGIVTQLDIRDRVTILYVGASEYSFNSSDNEVWLSRGVKTIRSVLGFPGTMLPSKKLHLVILAGFEVERAAEIILRYEPASLSIGKGGSEQSVSKSHYEKNKHFFDHLNNFVTDQTSTGLTPSHFEFSCVDPLLVKRQLLEHIAAVLHKDNKNIIVCPLNTKMSTVGVALAAIESPQIQICYAEPEEYNVDGYAKPGEEVTIFKLIDN